jgi:hypothetical protein
LTSELNERAAKIEKLNHKYASHKKADGQDGEDLETPRKVKSTPDKKRQKK